MSEHQQRRKPSPKTANLGADEFKQTLLKYHSREAKTRAQFALISLQVTNFDQLIDRLGDHAARVLSNIRGQISRKLREADRICTVEPNLLLLLLPESDANAARALVNEMKRCVEAVSEHNPDTPLNVRYQIADSADANLLSMLTHVGCELDAHGDLVLAHAHEGAPDLGSFDSWFARFEPKDARAKSEAAPLPMEDRWTGRKVLAQRIDLPSDIVWNDVIVRCRNLQQVEHPSFQPLVDFFVDRDAGFLFIATDASVLGTLPDFFQNHELNDGSAVELLTHYLSALIYAESLVPTLVLRFDPNNILVAADSSISLHGYEPEYIASGAKKDANAAAQAFAGLCNEVFQAIGRTPEQMASNFPKFTAIRKIAQSASSANPPADLNTAHKLRAAVKKIAERATIAPATTRES